MVKQILTLILIFSILFSGCLNLEGKTVDNKFKRQILQENYLYYNGQADQVDNVSERVFKTNKKYLKFFSLIYKNIINDSQENAATIGILDFKKVIRKIIRKHFLKIIDRKRDRQHRKRNLLI